MSTVMTRARFRRHGGTVWRDTGVHVLVMPPGSRGDVVVLGGGTATLWRLLADEHDVAELHTLLREEPAQGPDRAELEDWLAEMLGLRVLRRAPEVSS